MNINERTTRMKLDEIDLRMLEILQAVGCIPVSELAEHVSLSPMMCSLLDEDIVAMYHSLRSPRALGVELVCELLVRPSVRTEPARNSRLSMVGALG